MGGELRGVGRNTLFLTSVLQSWNKGREERKKIEHLKDKRACALKNHFEKRYTLKKTKKS